MANKSILLLLSTILIAAGTCGDRSGDEGNDESRAERALTVPGELEEAGPNEARILATVTAVFDERAESGPCAQARCRATIRVDSVLGYGSAFPRPISTGEHMDVRFAFTLAPTDDIDLNIDDSYPGLEPGEAFWAILQGRPAPGGTSFVVYAYHPAYE